MAHYTPVHLTLLPRHIENTLLSKMALNAGTGGNVCTAEISNLNGILIYKRLFTNIVSFSIILQIQRYAITLLSLSQHHYL